MRDTVGGDTPNNRAICGSLPARYDRLRDLAALGVVQLLAPPADARLGPGGREASRCALADHRPFELKWPYHLHHHAPRGRGRVDMLGQEAETGVPVREEVRAQPARSKPMGS
jgi:hypothetical protein